MCFKDKTYYINKVKYYSGLALTSLLVDLMIIVAMVRA